MSSEEVDVYLAGLDSDKRETLERLRTSIRSIVPEAEEGLSYGVPAYRIAGKPIAGFSAAKNHLSYLPHSGTILPELDQELSGLEASKGAIKLPVGASIPEGLLRLLIERRRREAAV